MAGLRDPDWGRSNPRSQGAEFLVLAVAVFVVAWAMLEAVSCAREIGRPLGIVGFLELFFRESIMLGVATLGAVAVVVAWIYQAMIRLWGKIRGTGSDPANEA
jgi:hypothetical protein